jgi:hypothetical protein
MGGIVKASPFYMCRRVRRAFLEKASGPLVAIRAPKRVADRLEDHEYKWGVRESNYLCEYDQDCSALLR